MQEEKNVADYTEKCDDPYIILGYRIVCHNTPETVRRFLTDYKFVKRVIIAETKELDFCGPFLDCLSVSIREEKQKKAMLEQLDALGGFFYNRLDLNRMRDAIRYACKRLEIDDFIEDGEKTV